jgi:hypothetical protein
MSNLRATRLWLCVFLAGLCALCSPALATHICWVEKASDVDGVLHVQMKSGYEWTVRSIAPSDGTPGSKTQNRDGSFNLKEGDTVLLSTFPHDSCRGKVAKKGDRLGLELEASMCMPGMACNSAKDFVSGE